MAHEFPKKEHYSNSKMMIDKNLLKRLLKLKELREDLSDTILSIQNQCKAIFNENEVNAEFKDIKNKFNNNVKAIFSYSQKTYPENVFKKEIRLGLCEACNNRRGLEKVHIIKKSVFRQPYSKWLFLKFHPVNIAFLCRDCHDMFDSRFNHNGEQRMLSKSKMKRMERNINKRIKRIKKAMKSDERYFQTYKKTVDRFNAQKKKMLSRLVKHLR